MFGKSIVLFAVAVGSAIAQQLTIESPASLIQCQPVLLKWSGGTAPYFLAAIPGNQPSAAAIKDFGQQSGTSLTWNVDLAAGQSITLKITDSSGAVNYNSAVNIQAGSSNACLTAGASSASGSAAAGVASATSNASSAAVAPVAGASSAAASAATSAASSATAAVSSASGAASSAASSASSRASSASSAASSASNTVSAAAASATTSKAAAFPLVQSSTGLIAAVAGLVGVALF